MSTEVSTGPATSETAEAEARELAGGDVVQRAFTQLARTAELFSGVDIAQGRRVFHFVFSLFQPDPMWPANLHAFPVPTYAAGRPIPPDGSRLNPVVIAVNVKLGDDQQALAVADYVVATLRRQAVVEDVLAGRTNLASLPDGVSDLDRLSHSEALATARALRAGRQDEIAIAISPWGFGLHVEVSPSWLPDRDAFAARVAFFGRCYNELPIVRDAVDRIVSATVGVGPRVSSTSEGVRRFVERAASDAKAGLYAAQAVRDAVLMGGGAIVMEFESGMPHFRLVRPDHLDLACYQDKARIFEMVDGGPRELMGAALMAGAPQPGSPYGASLLDPWTLTLYSALEIGADVRMIEASLPPPGSRSAAATQLAETNEIARRVAATAEASLRELLRPAIDTFEAPRYPLYFRGHEQWP